MQALIQTDFNSKMDYQTSSTDKSPNSRAKKYSEKNKPVIKTSYTVTPSKGTRLNSPLKSPVKSSLNGEEKFNKLYEQFKIYEQKK